MRHAAGLLLGILLTPALLAGAAWGYAQATASFDGGSRVITDHTRGYGAFALLAAAGLVAGVVIVARWASPLVSLVPALTLLGLSGAFLADPGTVLGLPARAHAPDDLDFGLRMLLGSGVDAMLGFALLVPTWAPRRWGGRTADEAPAEYYSPAGR
ncbi:hypothetical protein DZF91_29210 [Actinomadura logoneensis]|uniref:Uncharacterized protein n=1 Tax=Actinomadura logoneensis TaxID=2293572 RepID=A0A372JDQ8_9ACTN|nr:hypothetical protein [Actinomadura logoneensis]RFU38145.1 hypothetical protein DZF91_29210 [Actinomadura logoneensis]